LQRGTGDQLLEVAATIGVHLQRLIGELLDDFNGLTAGMTTIFVQRHELVSNFTNCHKITANPVQFEPYLQV